MSQLPRFSVVLVNYKTPQITPICLRFLKNALKSMDAEVWVVDNDSADASTEYLRSVEWIHLIERKPEPGEPGFMAHGCALDMVLQRITTDYLFLLHTDTFIYDPAILRMMLEKCLTDEKVVAVGCLDQIYRGRFRIVWRFTTRCLSHYFRRFKKWLGLKSKEPKPYYEVYLKSHCALWNTRILKQHGMTFAMNARIPGYELQDRLTEMGYRIAYLPARIMFRYLDHIEAGTVAETGGYSQDSRRLKNYHAMLEKLNRAPE